MTSDDDLLRDLADALTPVDRTPPPDRIAALRAAAAGRPPALTAHAVQGPEIAAITPHPTNRMRRIAAVAAVAAIAFALGGVAFDDDDHGEDLLAGGVVEFEATLAGPGGQATAAATGIRTGIGRTIQLRTDDLPILPPGDLYELWFVGPGDTPNDPNRISAGTFHPDDQGRSHVDLTAAVDPALYPELSVTSEPGDGNPAPTGPEVLRALITLDEP